jgi:hypothetical protein
MKKIYLLLFFFIGTVVTSIAQPFALALNNVDGTFTCNPLEDLGVYKRLRVQATQNSSNATWEMPQTCAFPGNIYRPYTGGVSPLPYNVIIPPTGGTNAALYNSDNNGVTGPLSPVVQGRYYTFNVQNTFSPTASPYIGVLETDYLPVSIDDVTRTPSAGSINQNQTVTITVTCSAAPTENVFVRYTTDAFATSSIVQVSFTGNSGTAIIPSGLPLTNEVRYYVYSSPKSKETIDAEVSTNGQVVHDMSTLEWNNNIGQNYAYSIFKTVSFSLGVNNMINDDAFTFRCNPLEDRGSYQRLRLLANQTSDVATWEFPEDCGFSGNIWRPYIPAGAGPIGFNTVIKPDPANNSGALWNSGNGGTTGNLSPTTQGNYYTFNVQKIKCAGGVCESPHIAVLETQTLPVNISSVTQDPGTAVVIAENPVVINVSTSEVAVENVFVRYTTDNFVTSTILPVVFTGTNGTANIPPLPLETNVKYYVYSSPKSQQNIEEDAAIYGEFVHDLYTLEWNNNGGDNYSYIVSQSLSSKVQYLRGNKQSNVNDLTWKAACYSPAGIFVNLEKANNSNKFTGIYSVKADAQRCMQPFNFKDVNPAKGINYYRLAIQEIGGRKTYSNVIAIINRESGFELINIYPTLVDRSNLTMNASAARPMRIEVKLTDISGKQLQRTTHQLTAGSNQLSIDASRLAPGTYFVTAYSSEGKSSVQRFVKR